MLALFQPLRRKLPLLISALLLLVVVAFGWLADQRLERTLTTAAEARLTAAAERIATLLGTQAQAMDVALARAAQSPVLVSVAERADTSASPDVVKALGVITGTGTRTLWDAKCHPLVSGTPARELLQPGWCPTGEPGDARATPGRARGAHVGDFVVVHDSVAFAITMPVTNAAGTTVGYLVETRQTASGESARLIGDLIGRNASLIIGNATGARVWTDLARAVSGPPESTLTGRAATYADSSGDTMLGVARPVANTPWLVWVQMPRSVAVAPAREALWGLAIIALVCLMIGAAGAWAVSAHVTSPLNELAHAADDIAAGNYARRVKLDRNDELGQLTRSFNTMAGKVQQSQRSLQEQASELLAQMEQAQALAQDLELANQELIDAMDETARARYDSVVARSLLDEVLTRAPVGIAVFDRELRYVRANEALAEMNGAPLDAHVGRRVAEVGGTLGTLAEHSLRRVLDSGDTLTNQRVAAEGVKRDWLASFFPVRGAHGEVTGAGMVAVETTAQRELEAQLLQAQKMEAVGRLAGGVAHDFNNLLTVITSYSEMALESLRPADPMRPDLMEIRAAAERAAALTKQLLAFSRKQMLRPQVVNLNDVATDMERMLQRLIGEDVTLTLNLAPDLGDVLADAGQLQQVVMNLAVNARDAMPQGGELRIETSNRQFSTELPMGRLGAQAGEYVVISVGDTGHGMTPETQAHLFEPFFTTKPAGQGTGLGLSTVYGIIKQSGGDIHVYSEPGHGTTFRIYLPRHYSSGVPARASSGVKRELRGSETILLAEDDPSLRALVTRVLSGAGYTVLAASTPTEVIRIGTEHPGPIDLLLTDVVMPELSGRTVGERLSAARPGLRVIYMSGYTDDDVVRRGIVAEEAEFIQKPFTPDHLTTRVREVLNASAPVAPR